MPTLEWIGKSKVINHHLDVPYRVLEEKYTYNAEKSGNMIIHGDNLEALKSLLPEFEGRVKCIYIDPPYNTGNEGWVYNDNVNDPKIRKWLGEVVGKEGEDLSRHDKWLCMMYPRLKLLHKLLSEDGVIFISIDDTEFPYLRLICDEIFRNFVEAIVWQKRTSPDARKKLSSGHEYILIYTKNADANLGLKLLPLEGDDAAAYTNPDNDPRGPWISSPFTAPGYRPNQMYQIITPAGKTMSPPRGRCWCNVEDVYKRLLAEGRMWFGADGNGVPRRKTYLSEREGRGTWTWWTNAEVGYTQIATQELAAILGKAVFDYPKPVRLISRVLRLASSDGDIILDSFAGSGTTAHAVLNMNKADGGHRRFILVEMMDYAESITAERVRRVIRGYGEGKNAVEGTGGDFSYYELGETLLLPDGNLNEEVGADKIRAYIWYTETGEPMQEAETENPYYLGTSRDTAYYFYYERDRRTTLNYDFLETVTPDAEGYLIYADVCTIPEEVLKKYNIVFKKIPRDIVRV
ncbi:MAG: site-specific DNA-methyltransferase [Ruminococcaceae bacterium]|jgi:adenine-specific DNA-methyltransferase|nr:site-specific DNA-methyltransferase [Oscillospiraceae bacterium]